MPGYDCCKRSFKNHMSDDKYDADNVNDILRNYTSGLVNLRDLFPLLEENVNLTFSEKLVCYINQKGLSASKLSSQFRCNGSDGYIAFLDDLLGICNTANYDGFDNEYEFEVFDDPNKMREVLKQKNIQNNKSRMIAGYCYEWISKKDIDLFDIALKNGFLAKWNFSSTSTWAIDEDSFDQIGCIHTSQGLEFDYVGIIIGNDLRYENGMVITDPTKRAKSDQSLRVLKKT